MHMQTIKKQDVDKEILTLKEIIGDKQKMTPDIQAALYKRGYKFMRYSNTVANGGNSMSRYTGVHQINGDNYLVVEMSVVNYNTCRCYAKKIVA